MGRTLTVKSAILFRPISIMAIKFFWNEVWDALNAETTRSLYLIQLPKKAWRRIKWRVLEAQTDRINLKTLKNII